MPEQVDAVDQPKLANESSGTLRPKLSNNESVPHLRRKAGNKADSRKQNPISAAGDIVGSTPLKTDNFVVTPSSPEAENSESFVITPEKTGEVTNDQVAATYLNELGLNWEDLKGKKILDLGSGLAWFAQAAKSKDVDVVSMDGHPEWWPEFNGPPRDVPFLVGDARQMPFGDETFDMIVSRAFVQAVAAKTNDLVSVINEAKRVLKPGGEFRFGPGGMGVLTREYSNLENKLRKRYAGGGRKFTPEEIAFIKGGFGYVPNDKYKSEVEEEIAKSIKYLQGIEPAIKTYPTIRINYWDPKHRGVHVEDVYYVITKPNVPFQGRPK